MHPSSLILGINFLNARVRFSVLFVLTFLVTFCIAYVIRWMPYYYYSPHTVHAVDFGSPGLGHEGDLLDGAARCHGREAFRRRRARKADKVKRRFIRGTGLKQL